MPAAQYDFSIENATSVDIVFNYLDEAENSVDLSQYAVIFRMISNNGDIYVYNNYTRTKEYSLTTHSNGQIKLNIPAKTTETFTFDSAKYDLEIQEPNEQFPGSGFRLIRLLFGNISIIKKNVPVTIPEFPSMVNVNECQDMCCDTRIQDPDTTEYIGGQLSIDDLTPSGISTISINSISPIQNIEVSVNNLNHLYPQDLRIFLSPPSGNKILLSGHDKIKNNHPDFNFTFSNKASVNTFLSNVQNYGYCNIRDKTNIIKLNNEVIESSFDNLIGISPSGSWSLIVFDDDPGGGGTIGSWNIYIKN